MNGIFFYEILVLIKSKNINACYYFLVIRTTIFIIEKNCLRV